jgi:hypothetical protein
MAFNLEHFTLTLATGLLVCLGLIILWNAVVGTRGLEILNGYEPKEILWAVALAVAFVVGFLAEDAFDSVGPTFFDKEEAKFWRPIDSYAFQTHSTPHRMLRGYEKAEEFLIPASKEKLRFESLFGSDAAHRTSDEGGKTLNWHPFARYYDELDLFSKLIPDYPAYKELNAALLLAIRENQRIPLEQCRAGDNCICYKIGEKCYPPQSVDNYIKTFVNQVYYHSKNFIYINKNYFDELMDRERRVNFSRSITYVSGTFFLVSLALLFFKILFWAINRAIAPFGSANDTESSFADVRYLIIPTLSFFLFAYFAKQANQFEQEQVNRRVFGYTTSLALLADKSGQKNAFERYFLGLGSDSGNEPQQVGAPQAK